MLLALTLMLTLAAVPYTVIGLVILVLDIIAIVSVLTSSGDTTYKLVWVLLILVLPLIGMLLYFLIGRGKTSL